MFVNPLAFLVAPHSQWQKLAAENGTNFSKFLLYPVVMIAMSTYAWFYGVTQVGWTVGEGEIIKISSASATLICVAAYFTMLAGLALIGFLVHWMSETYEAETSLSKGIALVSFTATPFYLAGLAGFYPQFWVDMVLGLAAVGWSVYLLYAGVPVFFNIPKERGFLYASAVSAVGMVMLMVLMGATVIAWDMGLQPVFID